MHELVGIRLRDVDRRAADRLVVHVGHVHDPGDAQANVAQIANQQVGEQERPEVADVGRTVDGRAARVDPDGVGAQDLRRVVAGEVRACEVTVGDLTRQSLRQAQRLVIGMLSEYAKGVPVYLPADPAIEPMSRAPSSKSTVRPSV